jgi:hypothetical protein
MYDREVLTGNVEPQRAAVHGDLGAQSRDDRLERGSTQPCRRLLGHLRARELQIITGGNISCAIAYSCPAARRLATRREHDPPKEEMRCRSPT